MSAIDRKALSRLLADAPTNWGKWGADDEIGALNYLTRQRNQIGDKGRPATTPIHPWRARRHGDGGPGLPRTMGGPPLHGRGQGGI